MKALLGIGLLLLFTACGTPAISSSDQLARINDQPIAVEQVARLSADLTETSGLEVWNGQLVTHNDSGDGPSLYFLNEQGQETYRVTYLNLTAVDWEDIAQDENYMYIADVGNNSGDRRDLTIYRLPVTEILNTELVAETLGINYLDQTDFSRRDQNHGFDAESLVALNGELYLFSKDWKDQNTQIYPIDQLNPEQSLSPVASYAVKGLITGATHNQRGTIMLCGYDFNLNPFILPVKVEEDQFIFGKKRPLDIPGGAQAEAITYFKSDNGKDTYYISCEAFQIRLGEDEAQSNAYLFKFQIPSED
ncbi:hypothetical protein [Nonlabens xiamenensis]|uniref:hypothetical protein n=1 Tax=Nonlabens xiamenensis TaxID=2341043 RepID=UPI000F612D8C|nr:hypothetical protein [Nonlabens xiamenensis]